MDANAYNDLGIVRLNKGDLDGAITAYRGVLGFQPAHADAQLNLGAALQAKGDLDGAIEQYRLLLAKERITPADTMRWGKRSRRRRRGKRRYRPSASILPWNRTPPWPINGSSKLGRGSKSWKASRHGVSASPETLPRTNEG